jgi:hypothetical protein
MDSEGRIKESAKLFLKDLEQGSKDRQSNNEVGLEAMRQALPDSIGFDYEPSEHFDGEGSIFSLPESISSKSSIQASSPTEDLVVLLIDHTGLPTLYPIFCQAFEFKDFKSQFHDLLKVFSIDVSKEASIPVEKESVRFISQQRRRISYAVGQEVFGLKKQALFQSDAQKQQLDRKGRIEKFLRDVAQSKGSNNEETVLAKEDQNSDNDSSYDEAELSDFSNLENVKRFIIGSNALEKLRLSVQKLAEQQKASAIRNDAENHGELKNREDPKPNESIEGIGIEDNIDPLSELGQVQISPYHTKYVKDVAKQVELQANPGLRTISSSSLEEAIYRMLARLFRPKIKAGSKRLEWKCVSSYHFF